MLYDVRSGASIDIDRCATRGSCSSLATGHLSLFLREVFHLCVIG